MIRKNRRNNLVGTGTGKKTVPAQPASLSKYRYQQYQGMAPLSFGQAGFLFNNMLLNVDARCLLGHRLGKIFLFQCSMSKKSQIAHDLGYDSSRDLFEYQSTIGNWSDMMFAKAFLFLLMCLTSLAALGQGAIDATSASVDSAEEQIFLKRTVAIARFTNETVSGTSFLVDRSGDRLGKQASDILSARLTATGRFLMFERSDIDEVQAEKIIAGMAEEGVSVEYLILGSVSEFGRSVESESGIFSRSKTQRAYAKVNVRLVEVKTGRIIYSEEGAGEAFSEAKKTLGVGGSAGFDQSLTDKAISAAISELVSSIVENLTKAPWKSYVLAKDQGAYIIAGGASQGVRPGDRFVVYQRGRMVTNPQTGAKIELPGKRVATIRVDASFGEDSFSEVSMVTVEGGTIGEDFSQYYITQE